MNDAAVLAVNLLQTAVEKFELSGRIYYCEVRNDGTIKRCQLQPEVLASHWCGCLRSGEVLVTLLHASTNATSLLARLGCPLLPLQVGSEDMDWPSLRCRFIGNWRNLHNVMRYVMKKCPTLGLQKVDANIEECIVDCTDPKKSFGHTLAVLTQFLVLLHAETILRQNSALRQSPASDNDDFSNPPALIYRLQEQGSQPFFQCYSQHQPIDVNNSANPPEVRHRRIRNNKKLQQHQQPKLSRLNGAKRVICVYDTTTEEDTNRSATTVQTVVNTHSAHQDTSGGPTCVLSFSIEALNNMFQSLDKIRSLLTAAMEAKLSDSVGSKLPTDTQLQHLLTAPPLSLPQPSLPSAALPSLEPPRPQQQQSRDIKPDDIRREPGHRRRRRSLQMPEPVSDSDSGPGSIGASGVSVDQHSEEESTGSTSIVKCGPVASLGQAEPRCSRRQSEQPAGTAAATSIAAKPLMQTSQKPPSTLNRRRKMRQQLNTATGNGVSNAARRNLPQRYSDIDSNNGNGKVVNSAHRDQGRTTLVVAAASGPPTRRARRRKSSTPASSTRVRSATAVASEAMRGRCLPVNATSPTTSPANIMNAGHKSAGRRSVKLVSAARPAVHGATVSDAKGSKSISDSTIQDLILRLQEVLSEDKN